MIINRDELLHVVKNAPLVSIDLVLLSPDGRILLGLRNNNPARDYWFVPGGRIRKDESIAEAFRRITTAELGEDIAVDVKLEDCRFLGVFEHFYETNFADVAGFGTHYVVLGYKIKLPSWRMPAQDDQHREFKWLTADEVRNRPDVHSNTKRYFQ